VQENRMIVPAWIRSESDVIDSFRPAFPS